MAKTLREALREVLKVTWEIQYDENALPQTVRFASKVHHIALQADTEKNYYRAAASEQESDG